MSTEAQKTPGMAVQALAMEIVNALLADEKDGGFDLTAGMFGAQFSALVRRWAALEYSAQASQAAELAALKADIAEYVHIASEQATEIERLNELLSFVERWANHHGRKPTVSAENALSVIQHHPAIKKITKSYTDGVVPTTRDPYAEIEVLRKDAARWKFSMRIQEASGRGEQMRFDAIDAMWSKVMKEHRAPTWKEYEEAIDAAMQTKEA